MITIISCHLLLAGFLYLIIRAVDAFLLLTALRLVLTRLKGPGPARYGSLLGSITDPARDVVQRWLAASSFRHYPWLPWMILVAGLVFIEAILSNILLSMR